MIRLDEVRVRVEARVPVLAGRLGNAGEFARLMESNQLPQVTPAGFVLPGGLAGGAASGMAGMFVQGFTETVLVVIVVRVAGDPLGAAAIDEASPIIREVVQALAGWGPADAPGVFTFSRGELVGAVKGALVFQVDFSLSDQLRIVP